MLDSVFEWVFLVGYGFYFLGLFIPFKVTSARTPIKEARVTLVEWLTAFLAYLGIQLIPLLDVFSDWFDRFDFRFPAWASWLGALVFAAALAMLFWSYLTLGRNWSASLHIRDTHKLITSGPYRWILHPIYAAMWWWALAQLLLFHNWISGFAGLILFAPVYFTRVVAEERMMLDAFGDQYRHLMQRTGRIFPMFRAEL